MCLIEQTVKHFKLWEGDSIIPPILCIFSACNILNIRLALEQA